MASGFVVEKNERYTLATTFAVEGARVGLKTCLQCGAAILLDPRDNDLDPLALHDAFHGAEPLPSEPLS